MFSTFTRNKRLHIQIKQGLVLFSAISFFNPTASMAESTSYGVWKNPKNTVHVRVEGCGNQLCGVVVWATEQAKADARKGNDQPLVGTQLFHNFEQRAVGEWQGRVFVPDLGRTFSGTVRMVGTTHLLARGCLFGSIGCKTQQWSRVAGS